MQQDPLLRSRARRMRCAPTPAEHVLWQSLRHTRLGTNFTRQRPIGPFIVDFAARRVKLVIELDGDTHSAQVAYDAARTDFLERQGYRVLRFTNVDVMTNLSGVLEAITGELASGTAPHPTPPPGGGGEPSVTLPAPGQEYGAGRPHTARPKDPQ